MNLHKVALHTADKLIAHNAVTEEQREIQTFGLEVLFASVLNGVLVFAASLLLRIFPQTILMLIPFIPIRSYAGGYHARTHLSCMAGFLCVYLLGVFCVRLIPALFYAHIGIIACAMSTVSLLCIGAIGHENRPVTDDEYQYFRRKARCLCIALCAVGIIGARVAPAWFIYYALGLFIAAASQAVEWIKTKCRS